MVAEPELATRYISVPDYFLTLRERRFTNSRFATSHAANSSAYTRRVLSACGRPLCMPQVFPRRAKRCRGDVLESISISSLTPQGTPSRAIKQGCVVLRAAIKRLTRWAGCLAEGVTADVKKTP